MRKRSGKRTAAFCMAACMTALTVLTGGGGTVFAAGENGSDADMETEAVSENGRQVINFNTDWRYSKGNAAGADQEEFDDSGWVYVNLPHSTDFYDADNKDAYLGISWYRKEFTIDPEMERKELLLTFEAVMQKAEIYLNGEKRKQRRAYGTALSRCLCNVRSILLFMTAMAISWEV